MGSLNEKVKRLDLLDIKLMQGAAVFAGIVLLKLLRPVLNIYTINIWWAVGIAVLLSIKPVYVVLSNWQESADD